MARSKDRAINFLGPALPRRAPGAYPWGSAKNRAPSGGMGMARFVIHEHHARNLHWDLRLEMDGVLKSWALPKIPPQAPGEKRLAIQVEDHALSYIDFEGHIDEGYGSGDVFVWDSGVFELKEEGPNKLLFNLDGKKMKGSYVMIIPGWTQGKSHAQWIFFKSGGDKPAKEFGPLRAPKSAAQKKRVEGKGKARVPRRSKEK